jgi:hypothetical protein
VIFFMDGYHAAAEKRSDVRLAMLIFDRRIEFWLQPRQTASVLNVSVAGNLWGG